MRMQGHNSHKPPIGKACKFISSHDANGNPDAQYYIRAPSPAKTITAAQKQAYGSEIKPDPKHSTFVNSTSEIREKFETD